MTTLQNIQQGFAFAHWLSAFEIKLSGQHSVDDVNGPVLENGLDGSYIIVGSEQYCVVVGNQSDVFDDYIKAAWWLWRHHSKDIWDQNH